MVAGAQPLIGRLAAIEYCHARHRTLDQSMVARSAASAGSASAVKPDYQSDFPHDVLPRSTSAIYDVTASLCPRGSAPSQRTPRQPTAPTKRPAFDLAQELRSFSG